MKPRDTILSKNRNRALHTETRKHVRLPALSLTGHKSSLCSMLPWFGFFARLSHFMTALQTLFIPPADRVLIKCITVILQEWLAGLRLENQ